MNDKTMSRIAFLPVGSAVIIAIFIFIAGGILPKKLPLFYSLPWGEQELGDIQQFFILPSLMICITFINLIISWQLHPKQYFFKIVLLSTSLLTSIILTVTLLKVILIFL